MTWYKILKELNLGHGLTDKGKRKEANQIGSPLSCQCHSVQLSSQLIDQPTFLEHLLWATYGGGGVLEKLARSNCQWHEQTWKRSTLQCNSYKHAAVGLQREEHQVPPGRIRITKWQTSTHTGIPSIWQCYSHNIFLLFRTSFDSNLDRQEEPKIIQELEVVNISGKTLNYFG